MWSLHLLGWLRLLLGKPSKFRRYNFEIFPNGGVGQQISEIPCTAEHFSKAPSISLKVWYYSLDQPPTQPMMESYLNLKLKLRIRKEQYETLTEDDLSLSNSSLKAWKWLKNGESSFDTTRILGRYGHLILAPKEGSL